MRHEPDELAGIPGLGPARRAALAAAGIASAAEIAGMTIDQLVGVTGMPRSQASVSLDAARRRTSADSPTDDAPPTDEAFPAGSADAADGLPLKQTLEGVATAGTGQPSLEDDDSSPGPAARARLDRAAFRLKTALSDLSRQWSAPRLIRPIGRLAVVLDLLSGAAGDAAEPPRPKTARRLSGRFDFLAEWLETQLLTEKPATKKRQERVRDRLRAERQQVQETIKTSRRRAQKRKRRGAT